MENIIAPSLILSYEYPWIHSYLNILLNNFPPQLDISLYPGDILQKSNITFFCMNDAVYCVIVNIVLDLCWKNKL